MCQAKGHQMEFPSRCHSYFQQCFSHMVLSPTSLDQGHARDISLFHYQDLDVENDDSFFGVVLSLKFNLIIIF